MSGEDSKRSGEIGEKMADEFLKLIGWHHGAKSFPIPCISSDHKTDSGNPKQSHGEDRVFIYNSPFHDNRTEVVHISVKNNLHGYPTNDAQLRADFSDHLREHNEIMACGEFSDKLREQLSGFKKRKYTEHSGLLIWTSSDNESKDRNIIEILKSIKSIDESCKKNVYIVDGARYNFILKAITHIRAQTGAAYEFYYPDPGTVQKRDERHGSTLPLELIISDVLPLKVTIEKSEILYIYVNQSFERDCYQRVLSLALGFAGAWGREIYLGFPDYNEATHLHEKNAAELPFSDRKKLFFPFCFNISNLNAIG